MYFSGTVGNICFIADAKSVMMTSAFCGKHKQKQKKKIKQQNKERIIIVLIYYAEWSHKNRNPAFLLLNYD